MAEELSVKDKIALFSKKKSNPVMPSDNAVSKQRYMGTEKRPFTEDKKVVLLDTKIGKIDNDRQKSDSEIELLKVIDSQEDQIKKLKSELARYKSFVEVRRIHSHISL